MTVLLDQTNNGHVDESQIDREHEKSGAASRETFPDGVNPVLETAEWVVKVRIRSVTYLLPQCMRHPSLLHGRRKQGSSLLTRKGSGRQQST